MGVEFGTSAVNANIVIGPQYQCTRTSNYHRYGIRDELGTSAVTAALGPVATTNTYKHTQPLSYPNASTIIVRYGISDELGTSAETAALGSVAITDTLGTSTETAALGPVAITDTYKHTQPHICCI